MKYYIEQFYIKNIFKSQLIIKGWAENKCEIEIYLNNKIFKNLNQNVERNDVNSFLNKRKNLKLGFDYVIDIPWYRFNVTVKILNKSDVIVTQNIKNNVFLSLYNKIKSILNLIVKTIKTLIHHPQILFSTKLLKKYAKVFLNKYKGNNVDDSLNPFDKNDYMQWIINNEIKEKMDSFDYNPLITVLIPVYNPEIEEFKECINSVLNQVYKKYEIVIIDDASNKKEVLNYLKEISNYDNIKVKYNEKNMHISKTTNVGLDVASGEYIAFLDQDDTLSENALYEVVKTLNSDKVDFIYSDFDKLDTNGDRCDPYFKPDFSLDTLLSFNYLSHLNVISKEIIDKVGYFNNDMIGAQDYDFYLRIIEKTKKIHHIPKILYHWRMSKNSTATKTTKKNYAFENGKKAIQAYFLRNKINAVVNTNNKSSFYEVKYLYDKEPKISILIPTRDYSDILKKCVDSILKKTIYKNYEIIIINNGSKEKKIFELFEEYKKINNIKIIDMNCEFNYSYLNNEAVKISDGEYIVLLNNDTEVITSNWLNIMVGYAMQEHIGAVGVKLLYPDNTIQHGGVILGLGGVASHSFIGEPRNYKAFNGLLEVPTNYSAVTAACLMVSKEKYLKVNGLDEELKVAYNDIDFNIRLLNNGYYNVFLPQVELYHHESKSRGLDTTGEKYERFLKESSIMYKRWDKYIRRDPFYNENYSLKFAYRLEKGNKGGYSNEKK